MSRFGAGPVMVLAALLLLSALPAAAQEVPTQVFEVPSTGFHGNNTYHPEDLWNEYQVHVPKGHELNYTFQVAGQGKINVYLIPEIGTEYIFQGSYYISYSSDEPVEYYSATFPPDHGFARDYTLVINSTLDEPVTYTAIININEVETPDYSLHYLLIILGAIGLVVFSWRFVIWQDRKEREEREAARSDRKSRRSRRR